MKKLFILSLCLVLLTLTACGGEESDADLVITRGNQEAETAVQEEPATEAAQEAEPLAFVYEGVELVPGAAFDPAVLPQADSVYQVPSCAIEGTDNVYSYGSFELTAFDDGSGEVIYSIFLIDPNTATPEGLALGDSAQRVTELYGEAVQDGAVTIRRGTTMLSLILNNDTVASIEYLMVTE